MNTKSASPSFYTEDPLEALQEMLEGNDIACLRSDETLLEFQVEGRWARYAFQVMWCEDVEAIQIAAVVDCGEASLNETEMARMLMELNAGMWLGHFDLHPQRQCPVYRYAALVRGMSIEDLFTWFDEVIDMALAQCDRIAPTLRSVMSEKNQRLRAECGKGTDLNIADTLTGALQQNTLFALALAHPAGEA